ncbi:MAG: profilin, required for normal timing of actin polymerization in response to thermal stress [Geoglossum umbratile]|nr:MAG: profilin, required for normal timing of actin polymerization in response to thermal stress [Geoglossum umbratile]
MSWQGKSVAAVLVCFDAPGFSLVLTLVRRGKRMLIPGNPLDSLSVRVSLVGTGKLDRAAIFNTEGTSVWASSPGFMVSPQEIKEAIGAYKDPEKVRSSGLYVEGEKYVVLKADDRSLYARKGKEGVCIVKTSQAILVSHYSETVQPGEAAHIVEQLADYLISVGY